MERVWNGDPSAPVEGYAIVNRRLIDGVAPDPVVARDFPGYLYWETPDTEHDSGWRILTGAETQDEVDDPSTFQINSIEVLLSVHPQLAQVLRQGVPGAWEWSATDGKYLRVYD